MSDNEGNRPDQNAGPEHARFAFDDAAYVLDALEETDRIAFEAHLLTCPLCRAAVADLGELPAFLGSVPAAEATTWELEPPPESLLPRLLSEIAASRRRRSWRTAGLSFAAACLLALLVVGGGYQWSQSHRPHPLAMQAIGPNPGGVRATVTLTGSGSDTRIELDCGYQSASGTGYPAGSAPSYRMMAYNRLGQERDLGSWSPQPGEDVQIARDSPWTRQNLSKIVISDSRGVPILSLSL
ncbi:MAG: zf-HC2 domain-containing protein [Actinomycetota bacterium]|nr:zf-HC2 domain-containing protein [Actinomycetota bacterium]MDQ2959070.1 zf-HC2 domain-containing protein [Actinomycetota bacterium]